MVREPTGAPGRTGFRDAIGRWSKVRRPVILLGATIWILGAPTLPALAGGGCHNTERSQGSGIAGDLMRCPNDPLHCARLIHHLDEP